MNNILYFESSDFNGVDIKPQINMKHPVLLMVLRDGCPHCDNAKPDYMALASESKNCLIGVVHTGHEPALGKLLLETVQSQGVPTFIAFNSSGKIVNVYTGNRDKASLLNFVNTLN
jgi:thiol-disulfide isomerase/thioredoxin